MAMILTIAGSPSAPSRTAAVLAYCADFVARRWLGVETAAINVRDLEPAELIHGRFDGGTVMAATALVSEADGIILATPVYKASYTGVLKSFLDVLPQGAFSGKAVLPMALGGSLSHALVIDYALRPVCVALNAHHVLSGVYLLDNQMELNGKLLVFNSPEAESRLHNALDQLIAAVRRPET